VNADDDLPGCRYWIGYLFKPHDLWIAERRYANRFHDRCSGSFPLRFRA